MQKDIMVISDLADVTLFSSQTSFVKNKFHQKSSRSLFEKHVPTSRITFLHRYLHDLRITC